MNTTPNQVRLINDCSAYHVGSALVSRELRRKIRESGLAEQEPAQIYLVNGEGTLHCDFPGVARIQQAIESRPQGSKLVIVNSLWSRMTRRFSGVSLAVARESLSAAQMQQDGMAAEVLRIPDVSLCCQHQPEHRGGGGLVVLDSVTPAVSGWLRELAREHGGHFVKMCEWKESAEALIDLLAGADAVVTGRFHGIMLAILAGTPFAVAPSNSWKSRGFMEDSGFAEHYHKDKLAVQAALHDNRFARVDRAAFLPEVERQWREVFQRIKDCEALPPGPMVPIDPKPSKPAPKAKERPSTATGTVSTIWQLPKTVVLVGNGPSVQGTRLGRIIDAHDEVVRFNNYRLRGFEDDIGSKTTLWSTFGKGMTPADSEPPPRCIAVHENATPEGQPREVIRIPHSFYDKAAAEVRAISKHSNAPKINPTSGFLVTRWLLENGCPRLHLAGFDHFSKERSKQHHYWNPQGVKRPGDHDGDAERELLLPFLMAGRLAYLS